MTVTHPARRNVIAVLVATTAALVFRAWIEVDLRADGVQKDYAADLAYLIVPPALLVLLFPVLRQDRGFLLAQFSRTHLSLGVVWRSIAVGISLRALWWSTILAAVSFGIYRSDNPLAIEGPRFVFQCAAPEVVALGFLVMAVLVPVFEEVTHRAYVMGLLRRRGPIIAVSVSTMVFTVFHPLSSWGFASFCGVVFGIQYWNTGSLWPSILSHATVNGIIQIDWRCLRGQWNPSTTDLPVWHLGICACVAALLFLSLLYFLLRKSRTGAAGCPGPERVTERLPPVR